MGYALLGGVRSYVFVKMKLKIVFDRHIHDFFLGKNEKKKNALGPIPNLSFSSSMQSIIEPVFRCTFGSKWSEIMTFSHRFAVFSTWGEAHRGLLAEADLIDEGMKKNT